MKGKMGCYATGGRMRNMGGVKAPAYGMNNKVMSEAKGKTTGIVKMDGPEGGPSKPRLDRPGRKMGGRAKHKAKSDSDDDDRGSLKPGFIKHPGALREALRAKSGEPIPAKKLDQAAHSDNPTLRRRAILAKTMRSWHHGD